MRFHETADGISYLYDYYPARLKRQHEDSDRILAFKHGNADAIKQFSFEMKTAMDEKYRGHYDALKNTVVCIMPSHEAGNYGEGLTRLAAFLVFSFGMIDGIHLIKRIQTHGKISEGGDRSIRSHLETLEISTEYQIAGKNILILDDITTSGNSIESVRRLLRAQNVGIILAQTLGKTISDDDSRFTPLEYYINNFNEVKNRKTKASVDSSNKPEPDSNHSQKPVAKRKAEPVPDETTLSVEQQAVFEYLRQIRLEIAREEHISAFRILTNKALVDFVLKKPADKATMYNVHGVSRSTVEKYGSRLLSALNNYRSYETSHPQKSNPQAKKTSSKKNHGIAKFKVIGKRIEHRIWGTGSVINIDGDNISVRFDNGSTKKLNIRACMENRLIYEAE